MARRTSRKPKADETVQKDAETTTPEPNDGDGTGEKSGAPASDPGPLVFEGPTYMFDVKTAESRLFAAGETCPDGYVDSPEKCKLETSDKDAE